MADALFERDGSRFVPTELARGPWTPGALHGGPQPDGIGLAESRLWDRDGRLGPCGAEPADRPTLSRPRVGPTRPRLVEEAPADTEDESHHAEEDREEGFAVAR